MDIVQVQSRLYTDEPIDEEEEDEEMAARVQGDYSGYVPPEVVVTSDVPAATSPRRQVQSREKGGAVRPASPTEVPVLVRGNLQKLGKRLKGWHQRYFEIQGSHMYYYKNHTKKECLGEIKLENCYYCDATSAPTFGHPFEIRTTQRSHTLAARTNDEMVQWVRTIRANMGTTAEEAAAKKAAKPKRWESFKNALSIQPKRSSAQQPPTTTKKKHGKSFVDRIKIQGGKRSRSPSPARADPRMSSRPMSLTENDLEIETLDILANVPPTRSLPATPLSTKRPVDFNESPPDSPYLRTSTASPALTLDSVTSTPSHTSSVPVSPAHTVNEKTEEDIEVTTAQETEQEQAVPNEEESTPGITVPPITLIPADESLPVGLVTQEPTSTVATSEVTEPEISMPPSDVDSKLSTPQLPEVLKKRFTWDDIREVLDSYEEEGEKESYDGLPSEEPVWLEKSSGVEQLRGFLLTCP